MEITNSHRKIFEDLKKANNERLSKIETEKKKLTSAGRKYYIFPILEENGFDTFDKIMDECEQIINKTSKQSRVVRDAITTLCFWIVQEAKPKEEAKKS